VHENAFLDAREGPRDECGVFGIVAPEQEVARLAYFALYALQHRGQESAGIAASQNGHIMAMRDQGLVNQVFDEQKLRALQGEMAIGHVRYSTTGANSWENTQPVWRADKREVALAHNGNLINAVELHGEHGQRRRQRDLVRRQQEVGEPENHLGDDAHEEVDQIDVHHQ